MAQTLKIRRCRPSRLAPSLNKICPVVVLDLDSGETLRRGCGRRGMYAIEGGWRCFYCGRYVYDRDSSLQSLWFHFRWAREFWHIREEQGRRFINGVPVNGSADPLPERWRRDLSEKQPPVWFESFLSLEESEFQNYLHKH